MKPRLILLISLSFISLFASAGKREGYDMNIGETITLYSTPHSGGVTFWDWDSSVFELQGQLYEYSTQATFKAIKKMDVSRSVIQVTTYYTQPGTSSTGRQKDLDVFQIYVFDNSTVSLYPQSATLKPGDQLSLSASASSGYSGGFTWYNSAPSALSLYDYGSTATIYAKSAVSNAQVSVTLDNGKSATCYITVLKVDPESVTIPASLTVYADENATITPQLRPTDAQTTYSWYSTDRGVATVSGGVVHGVDRGEADVYCITANNKRSNDCHVTVLYRTPTSISVSPADLTMNLHETRQLSYSVKPDNARTTVTWESKDKDCAEVSQTGLVTPKAPGTARITVTTDVASRSATCKVTVLPDPDKVEIPAKMLQMYGTSRKIPLKVTPSDAYVKSTWTTDNPSVAIVDGEGNITARGEGTANITVTTHNGCTSTCRVDVPAPDFRMWVWLNDGRTLSYPVKDYPKIVYTEGADEAPGTIEIRSAAETAEFAAADVRKFTIDCDMTSPMPSAIAMTDELHMKYGQTAQLQYTLYPEDYDFETSLAWSSSDDHVSTVSQTGLVRAVGGGEADITLEATNGCKAVCRVSVPEPEFWLVVWLTDGRRVVKHLGEKPVVRYADSRFTLATADFTADYAAEDVRKFTLTDNPAGDDPEGIADTDISAPVLTQYSREQVTITGGTPGAETQVYNTAGMLVGRYTADPAGTTVIPLSAMPAGVLLIHSETITYKIIKK